MMPVITQKYTAEVTHNQDPEQRGRIRCKCPDYLGSDEAPISSWIEPVWDWGWFVIPDLEELVEIEIVVASDEDEHFGQSKIWNPDIRWKGKRFWGGTEDTTGAPRPIPDDFKVHYGKRRGFATPAGHIIIFDDTEGEERVSITWAQKTNQEYKYAYLSVDKDGSIIIGNKTGSLIYLNAKDGEASMIDEHGNTIAMASTGIKIIDKFSNIIELKDGAIQVLGQGGVTISCKDAHLNAGNVELGKTAILGVARQTDLVIAGIGMTTWMAAVAAALNTLGQPIVPPAPPDFGIISGASTIVKAM